MEAVKIDGAGRREGFATYVDQPLVYIYNARQKGWLMENTYSEMLQREPPLGHPFGFRYLLPKAIHHLPRTVPTLLHLPPELSPPLPHQPFPRDQRGVHIRYCN